MATKAKYKVIKVNKLVTAIIAMLLVAVVAAVCIITHNKATPKPEAPAYIFNKDIAEGIDVSEHNGRVNWNKVKEQYDFAFIRVGYRGYAKGNICEDKYAKSNIKGASKAGVPFGVYFYTQAITTKEAENEAEYLLDIIRHYDVKLPVMLDFEYATNSSGNTAGRLKEAHLSPQQSAEIINAFCSVIGEKGYTYGVYASSSMLKFNIATKALDKNAVIWVADYNSSVSYKVDYSIWQYSKTGKSDAVSSKYVDLNYWYKDR